MLHHDIYICVGCYRELPACDVDPDTVCEASSTDICPVCLPGYSHLIRRRGGQVDGLRYTTLPSAMVTINQARLDNWDYADYQDRMDWFGVS